MHWGIVWAKQPMKSQIATASFLRNAGVHIIVGCHSHTLQGHSFDKNSVIAYSLGNFVFGPVNTNHWVNMILLVHVREHSSVTIPSVTIQAFTHE